MLRFNRRIDKCPDTFVVLKPLAADTKRLESVMETPFRAAGCVVGENPEQMNFTIHAFGTNATHPHRRRLTAPDFKASCPVAHYVHLTSQRSRSHHFPFPLPSISSARTFGCFRSASLTISPSGRLRRSLAWTIRSASSTSVSNISVIGRLLMEWKSSRNTFIRQDVNKISSTAALDNFVAQDYLRQRFSRAAGVLREYP